MSIHKGQKIERPKYKALYESWQTEAERLRRLMAVSHSSLTIQSEETEAAHRLKTAAQLEALYYRQWAIRFGVAALLMGLALIGTCFR
jgi:hypothetical protein